MLAAIVFLSFQFHIILNIAAMFSYLRLVFILLVPHIFT